MQLKISKAYVICPANVATGGPELLHQLAYQLKIRDIDASMLYIPEGVENPVHPFYEHYDIPYNNEIFNTPENILIIPEALANMMYDKRFSKMQKAIWWLSVDNYVDFINAFIKSLQHKKTFKIKQFFNYYKIPTIERIAKQKKIIHLVQSFYAKDFLLKNGISNAHYLSDYLGISFFKNAELLSNEKREDIVLYNPKKGIEFTEQIIQSANHIKFLPIQNLSPQEVSELLARSKVYIDFGNHPGKDRFPREAAIMGCCVITNKKGSANFYEDVPIGDEFKFVDEVENIPNIISKIEECFNNFDNETIKLASYRDFIKNEEREFGKSIDQIFTKNRIT